MIGVVLAGGASSRFGGRPKGLIEINGRAMALRVADMLAPFCTRVVIEAKRGAGYEALGLALAHAEPAHDGKGPLAGIAAGLAFAGSDERVAFAPCDMPLLRGDIYHALAAVGGQGAYAQTAHGVEPLVAALSGAMLPRLLEILAGDVLPRTHAALDAAGAVGVVFNDAQAFANVNSPDDLARLGAT